MSVWVCSTAILQLKGPPVHLLLTPTIRGRYCYNSRVTDEKVESQRSYLMCLKPAQEASSRTEATTLITIIITSNKD